MLQISVDADQHTAFFFFFSEKTDERDESLLGCLVHSLIMTDENHFSVIRLHILMFLLCL